MARPVSRAPSPNERSRIGVWLPTPLRDRLARYAFERGVSASAVVEEALRALLAREGEPAR